MKEIIPNGKHPVTSQGSPTIEDILSAEDVLTRVGSCLQAMTPQLRKAATFLLENPNLVGVSSIREIAELANVKPNTYVRMARSIGFDGYDELRELFRDEIRTRTRGFPEQARSLQVMAKGGQLSGLFAEMAVSAVRNVERTFAATSDIAIKNAAMAIVNARKTYVLGVGVNSTNARNFTYLADMALDTIRAIPDYGSTATDDLVRANSQDVLIAMTSRPYRVEVVEAVQIARSQGVTIIAISDSPASPIVIDAKHKFIVDIATPQFFPSSVSTIAVLETLMAFVIADAEPQVIENIEKFHSRRHELGLYRDCK